MKVSRNRSLVAVSGVALAIALASPAAAQDVPSPTAQPAVSAPADTADQTDIVVTGRPAGSGINKLEAGYSITTLSADDLKLQAPKSSGDALKSIPGVWVESSGGVGTSNIFVRGIPSTGDAPFVTLQFNGIPVYGVSSLSFMDQTGLVRIDETVAGIEGVNGGPQSLYSDGQAGLTTNLRLREGGEVTHGSIGASITDYSAWRTDGYLSGKVADDLYYMVGGYISRGDSVRRAGFDTEKGQQFTANITKKFAGGKFNIFARYTDDHGEWFLPFAANVPGLDLGRYNQLNQYTRYATIISPGAAGSGATERVDLAQGRGWKGVVTGASLDYDFGGGLSVTDRFGFTSGTLRTAGLVPAGAGAVTVATALATAGTPGQTTVRTLNTGQTLAATDYVQQFGSWLVEKKLQNVSNEAVLNFKRGANTLNLGYYFSHFTSDDAWSLGGNRWAQVGGSGDLVNLNNGTLSAFDISDRGRADVNAVYLSDSFNITEALRIDAGVRHQWTDIDFTITGNGLPNAAKIHREATPWTVGVNYRALRNLDVYARISQGYHSPSFDDVRSQLGNTGPRLDLNWSVRSYEGGVKYRGGGFEAALTGFYDEVVGAVYNDVGVPPQIAGSKTKGIELDASYHHTSGLGFTGNAVLEDAKTDTPGIPAIDGKNAQRIPSYQVRVTPTYTTRIADDSDLTLYGTYEAIGKRYSDLANTQLLPAYATVSAGLRAKIKGYTLQVAGDNLTNSHGLTEGNPRFLAGPGAALPDVRPIFGRSYRVTVSYAF
ncbi:outer membrane receptor for ferrienterochelin and colicin [Sphingomonas sp. BE270]|jgi:iron complex outermembrane receptor protein|uniref:TonB-dependent receptor n=2 Tax=Sphingomonas TaxID=13687 RepID=UPI00053D32A8|nr:MULTISPECIES: TonB-dependent receptor [unclassified Sphingomonas]MDR6847820.1 outer membrane receptor for ferrienterochelin and colicin [Sphingomonas sp. BE137]MDR7258500.1 outer membrane receptor for ferrienterochelin and colicin [Sphingomonas sp. BE270]